MTGYGYNQVGAESNFVPNMHFPLSVSQVLSVAALVSLAGAVTVPGASTPSFYLVASTNATTGANLLVSHIPKDLINRYSLP